MRTRGEPSIDPGARSDGREADQERVRQRYAAPDAERMRGLTEFIAKYGRCRYCNRQLTDEKLARTPGVCGATKCKRIAERAIIAARRG